MEQIDVAVWGSTGYAGQELVGILEHHPNVGTIRPVKREEATLRDSEAAFLALPHGIAGKIAGELAVKDNVIIDLSGDLRFSTPELYKEWYHQDHPAPHLLPVPYALPELNRDQVRGARVISVPGCYPTATLLGAVPLTSYDMIKAESNLVVNAISGVSGRDKKPNALNHFMNISGNVVAYNTGRVHRHVGEIEQLLGGRSVFFSPKVAPVERGMLVETTSELTSGVSPTAIAAAFDEFYDQEPFVKVLPEGELPDIHSSVRTDGCYIGFIVTNKLVHVVSSIDNLRKGAASQAVQAFNIAHGLPETAGLKPLI